MNSLSIRRMSGSARLWCAAIVALVLVAACGGTQAGPAPSVAAVSTPTVTVTPPPPPSGPAPTPVPTASPGPTAAITIALDPPAPVNGAPFEVVVTGLAPGEVVTILVLPVGLSSRDPARTATADAVGTARQSSIFTNPSFHDIFARVTRADGRQAELQFSLAAAAGPGTSGAPAANASSSRCDPGTGPSGTRFFCIFYGFPPNAMAQVCFARVGSASRLDSCSDLPIQPNGTMPVGTHDPAPPGTYTYTVTVGAQTQSLSITVTP
jgi:hypothetical protein